MNTFDEQKNNGVYINLNQDNSLLTVEGQKKMMRYRMRYMWPFLLIILLPLAFTFYNSFRLSQITKEKILQQQSNMVPQVGQQNQQLPITEPAGKCQALTLSQYGTLTSPEAQQLQARCRAIEAQAELQRDIKK